LGPGRNQASTIVSNPPKINRFPSNGMVNGFMIDGRFPWCKRPKHAGHSRHRLELGIDAMPRVLPNRVEDSKL